MNDYQNDPTYKKATSILAKKHVKELLDTKGNPMQTPAAKTRYEAVRKTVHNLIHNQK